MDSIDSTARPSKRLRTPLQPYEAGPATYSRELMEEERMLAQAIANSKKDQARQPVTTIPFGPTFYPTVEEFSGDPLIYLEKIRGEAEKYGEFLKQSKIYLQSLPQTTSIVNDVNEPRLALQTQHHEMFSATPTNANMDFVMLFVQSCIGICKIVPPKGKFRAVLVREGAQLPC